MQLVCSVCQPTEARHDLEDAEGLSGGIFMAAAQRRAGSPRWRASTSALHQALRDRRVDMGLHGLPIEDGALGDAAVVKRRLQRVE